MRNYSIFFPRQILFMASNVGKSHRSTVSNFCQHSEDQKMKLLIRALGIIMLGSKVLVFGWRERRLPRRPPALLLIYYNNIMPFLPLVVPAHRWDGLSV